MAAAPLDRDQRDEAAHVVFIGIVLRRKLVVHQRSGAFLPAEMTEEDEGVTFRVGQPPRHGREPGRYTVATGDEANMLPGAVILARLSAEI